MSVRGTQQPMDERCGERGAAHRVDVERDEWLTPETWPDSRAGWRVTVLEVQPSGCLFVLSERLHRTLYGARMAARQARIDYAPGGRLYARVSK